AGSFAGNLRAATSISLNYSDLFMNITVSGTKIRLAYKKHINKPAGVEVEFCGLVWPETIDVVKGAAIPAEILIVPSNIPGAIPVIVVSETIVVPSTITSSTTATPVAPAGVSTTTPVTVSPTVEIDVLTEVKKIDSTATIASPYVLSSVTFGSSPVANTTSGAPFLLMAASSYVFTATMNQAYTNVSVPIFTLQMDNLSDNRSLVFTGEPYIAVAWNEAKTIATITFTPSSTDINYQLESGKTYCFKLTSTNAVGAAGVKFTMPAPIYIAVR
ncbi:MAG: hypothetical protein PHD82_15415, partial [Candidatus Riflebacteria bacterium]|nr:hypothetical protein [Candidatus Riflebacteria bacterium]